MLIRPRRDDDLAVCADLVREVHVRDRYPRFLQADIGSFLALSNPYGCWVADQNGEVVGHIALVPPSIPSATELAAQALGRREDQLAVVARLFVSPRARGQGAGRLLLNTATAEAAARGLWPVLDVDTELAGAVALYESQNWTRAGEITVRWSDGRTMTEYVYLAPDRWGEADA